MKRYEVTDLPSPIGLSPDARRAEIRSFLPGFIEQGYSANAALAIFRGAGLGIARGEFLEIYRDVLGLETRSGRIQNVGGDNIPSDAVFDPSSIDLPAQYRMIAKFSVINIDTLETQSLYRVFDTDSLDTINNMQDSMRTSIRNSTVSQSFEVGNVDIIKGFISQR